MKTLPFEFQCFMCAFNAVSHCHSCSVFSPVHAFRNAHCMILVLDSEWDHLVCKLAKYTSHWWLVKRCVTVHVRGILIVFTYLRKLNVNRNTEILCSTDLKCLFLRNFLTWCWKIMLAERVACVCLCLYVYVTRLSDFFSLINTWNANSVECRSHV